MKGKNTQKNQGTILQNYYFLSLKLVWGKLLWKVICCMLSWEPFSTGAFIINHTFPRTNHHALKKPFWGSQRLIYLLLCCGSKQSTKSTILQLYTCLAADSNMYSMYRSHVKAGFRHVGAPTGGFRSCACQQVVPMRSASVNVNHSVLRQSGNTVVQTSCCCPFTRQKNPKQNNPCLTPASPVL